MSDDSMPRAEGPPPGGEPPGGPEAQRASGEPSLRMPERPAAPSGPDPRVAELEAQKAEIERQLQRLAADFDNFRRRAASEKDELVSFAASRVLENLLPINDNFERALAHAKTGDAASILQGVELIYKQIQDFLARHGVAAMEPVGQPFDPNLHEAIATTPSTEHPDQTVLAVAQKGYFLNGRVLRHAMVQVADNPNPAPAAPVPQQEEPQQNAPAAASSQNDNNTLTLEDLMAEAQDSEGAKEESHG